MRLLLVAFTFVLLGWSGTIALYDDPPPQCKPPDICFPAR